MRLSLLAAAAAFSILSAPAFAAQDTPITANGAEAVCTGVGSAKDDPRWSAYPVKIVLATSNGANLANAQVTLTKSGQTVMQFECDAPWILFRAAGSYSVTATLAGSAQPARSVNFTSSGHGPQKELTLTFPAPAARASN